MSATPEDLTAAFKHVKKLVYWRNYYDENKERILARQMERYAAKREGRPTQKRGPKPKSREISVTIGPKGEVRVG
jgi:hypothetical protein